MPVTLRQTAFALAIGIAFVAFGTFVVDLAWDDWVHQQIRLTHRAAPRLITYATNRDEFILRCASLALFGGAWLCMGLAVGCGVAHRLAVLRRRFFTGAVQAPLGVLLPLWVGVACFAVWFPLICFIKLYFP